MRRLRLAGFLALAVLAAAALGWWMTRPPAPALVSVAFIKSPATGAPIRSRLISADPADKRRVRSLTPQFQAVSDPEISFDGLRLLFAGRRAPSESWQIWEMRRDGGGLRQVTGEQADCTEPHYVTDLPAERILFTRALDNTNALYTCALDGSKIKRLTFNRDPIRDTLVLPDGRIAFKLRGQWVTVNNDGTGVAAYTGSPEDIRAAREQLQKDLSPTAPRTPPTGHVSVVDPKKRKTGLLFCLNAYLSDRPGLRSLPEGTICKVRVWAAASEPRVLGEAPVGPDGSFLIEVPADTPLRFQTIGAGGKVVGEDPTWIWVRPNESRGCIGCHEDRDLTPENQVQTAIERKPVRLVPASKDKP
jgi:hypothetical protein